MPEIKILTLPVEKTGTPTLKLLRETHVITDPSLYLTPHTSSVNSSLPYLKNVMRIQLLITSVTIQV